MKTKIHFSSIGFPIVLTADRLFIKESRPLCVFNKDDFGFETKRRMRIA